MSLRQSYEKALTIAKNNSKLDGRDNAIIDVILKAVRVINNDGDYIARIAELDDKGNYVIEMQGSQSRFSTRVALASGDIWQTYCQAAGNEDAAATDLVESIVHKMASQQAFNERMRERRALLKVR